MAQPATERRELHNKLQDLVGLHALWRLTLEAEGSVAEGSVAHPERVTQPGVVQGDPAAGGQVVSCCIHDDSFLQAASPCRRRAAFDQGR